ncbi:MAG TPA: ABC transporter permease [Thermoanaerobaculia bacterium]|nr:ABC transporter permease [Thermoanaerobaculia bacterium]
MQLENAVIVARREYLTRVRSKGFWIGTLALPLFAAASILLPTLFLSKSGSVQRLVIVDETGQVAPALQAEVAKEKDDKAPATEKKTEKKKASGRSGSLDRATRFDLRIERPANNTETQRADLNRRVLEKEIDAWVWVQPAVLTGEPVEYHARSLSNFITQANLQRDLTEAVRRVRFQRAGFDPAQMGDLTRRVELETIRISKKGSHAEGGEGSMLLGIILFLTLYMTLMIWGQQVMTGVLEEKGSRVIEVVISAIKPSELLTGKLLGIGLAALTQFAIWLTTLVVITGPGILASLSMMEEGALPPVTLEMVLHLTILFVLGFLTFSTLYAAIGAAFNNVQEAQQAAGLAVFGLVVPVFFLSPVINDPNSTLAVTLSLIPLFTPLLMALRVSAEMPPLWQLLLSYTLTFLYLCGMIWVCSRIYRVGILMYGKKPTIQEMWKWVRYS